MRVRRPLLVPVIVIALVVALVAAALPLVAAKFPTAVEKTIVLSGPSATTLAALFELSDAAPAVSLAMGRGTAWAIYLLKQDTPERLLNDNNGSPPRWDELRYSAGPVPTLTISPFWLDLGTALPSPQVGAYSFSGPFLPEKLEGDDPWTKLVRRLEKDPSWKKEGRQPFHRCFASTDGTEICLDVFKGQDYKDNKPIEGFGVGVIARIPQIKS